MASSFGITTIIPAKETVSYRFMTIRVGATAIHQMPKGGELVDCDAIDLLHPRHRRYSVDEKTPKLFDPFL
jgi:hypothetical protein